MTYVNLPRNPCFDIKMLIISYFELRKKMNDADLIVLVSVAA